MRWERYRLHIITGFGALLICGAVAYVAYNRGARDAELRVRVEQLDKARAAAADTSAALAARVDAARAKSDSVGRTSRGVVEKAEGFRLIPVPARSVLQGDSANSHHTVMVNSLLAVIANRDSALALERTARRTLTLEVASLRAERAVTDSLLTSLREEIRLGVAEINLLRAAKTPRFGFKTGFVAGAATVVTVAIAGAAIAP